MRILMASLIAIVLVGCNGIDGGSDGGTNISCGTNIPPDMAVACPTTINEGDVCNRECIIEGGGGRTLCSCGVNGIWTCSSVDGGS